MLSPENADGRFGERLQVLLRPENADVCLPPDKGWFFMLRMNQIRASASGGWIGKPAFAISALSC
jgi:hypothetical protein